MRIDFMALGQWGETIAARYLEKKGYRIIQKNFRCRSGEIDIIAMDGFTLVFVEVKTRSNQKYGLPCEAVNRVKLQHMKRVADYFKLGTGLHYRDERMDVVEILVMNENVYLNHMENITG